MYAKIFSLTLLTLSMNLFAEELKVDKSHSEVQFTVSHLMISKVTGEFTEFDAKIAVENDKLVSVNATIPVSGIDTGNKKRDDHLKSPDFFNAEKFPNILFESTKVEEGKLTGNLTIHGTTKEVVLDLSFQGPVQDPWGNTVYGLSLEGEIDRTAFGLTWNKALETGGVVVGDLVKISINLELNK